jgi:hypothetical protein
VIEPLIVAVIGPLVGSRIYPDVAPAGTPFPYATFQQVGGKAFNYMDPTPVALKAARIQISVWSKTRQEAMTLIRQIEDALVVTPTLAHVEGAAIARYDEETKLRGAMQDFSFTF